MYKLLLGFVRDGLEGGHFHDVIASPGLNQLSRRRARKEAKASRSGDPFEIKIHTGSGLLMHTGSGRQSRGM